MGWSGRCLPAHRDLHRIAPHAHLRIADAVDGAVFPFGRGGWEGEGVGVITARNLLSRPPHRKRAELGRASGSEGVWGERGVEEG